MNIKILKRAENALLDYSLGLITASRLKHFKDVRVIRLGIEYRLVSFNRGKTFEIMSHSEYDKHINKRKAHVAGSRRRAR
ncbi:hypothetical protein [Yersinia phage vB_YenM_P744]